MKIQRGLHGHRHSISLEVNLDLLNAVKREQRRHSLTFREVIEWGMIAYLGKMNPGKADKLAKKEATAHRAYERRQREAAS